MAMRYEWSATLSGSSTPRCTQPDRFVRLSFPTMRRNSSAFAAGTAPPAVAAIPRAAPRVCSDPRRAQRKSTSAERAVLTSAYPRNGAGPADAAPGRNAAGTASRRRGGVVIGAVGLFLNIQYRNSFVLISMYIIYFPLMRNQNLEHQLISPFPQNARRLLALPPTRRGSRRTARRGASMRRHAAADGQEEGHQHRRV